MIKVLKMKDGSGAISLLQGDTSMFGLLITQSNGDAAAVTLDSDEVRALRAALFDVR